MRKVALLVGVDKYPRNSIGLRDLNHAGDDACDLGKALLEDCRFDTVRVLAGKRRDSDGEPDMTGIKAAMAHLSSGLKDKDLFLLFFAGHGHEDNGQGYLLPSDCVDGVKDCLSVQSLKRWLTDLPCRRRIALIDACRRPFETAEHTSIGGSIRRDIANLLGRGAAVQSQVDASDPGMGSRLARDIKQICTSSVEGDGLTVVLSACKPGQCAYECEKRKHGLFAYYLCEGIRGNAWHRGRLRLSRLARYTSDQVKRCTRWLQVQQTPTRDWETFEDIALDCKSDNAKDQAGEERKEQRGGGRAGGWAIAIILLAIAGGAWLFFTGSGRKAWVNSVGMEFMPIEAGTFTMGSAPGEEGRHVDEPQREVTISRRFWMGATEVTQSQWRQVMNTATHSNFRGDNLPVECVSLEEVEKFCEELSRKEGRRYRLPTEEEWEYACRGGTSTPFSTGNTMDRGTIGQGWQSLASSRSVGDLRPNDWGLRGMHGNVWEWCSDTYQTPAQLAGGASASSEGTNHVQYVIRGGSWMSSAEDCRAARRVKRPTNHRSMDVGFRIVCEEAGGGEDSK